MEFRDLLVVNCVSGGKKQASAITNTPLSFINIKCDAVLSQFATSSWATMLNILWKGSDPFCMILFEHNFRNVAWIFMSNVVTLTSLKNKPCHFNEYITCFSKYRDGNNGAWQLGKNMDLLVTLSSHDTSILQTRDSVNTGQSPWHST